MIGSLLSIITAPSHCCRHTLQNLVDIHVSDGMHRLDIALQHVFHFPVPGTFIMMRVAECCACPETIRQQVRHRGDGSLKRLLFGRSHTIAKFHSILHTHFDTVSLRQGAAAGFSL